MRLWGPENLSVSIVDNTENIVKEGESFQMVASADDPDSDPVTFTWTCPQISSWSAIGNTVNIPEDLTTIDSLSPGTYTFNVVATDGRNGEATRSISILVEEKEAVPPPAPAAPAEKEKTPPPGEPPRPQEKTPEDALREALPDEMKGVFDLLRKKR